MNKLLFGFDFIFSALPGSQSRSQGTRIDSIPAKFAGDQVSNSSLHSFNWKANKLIRPGKLIKRAAKIAHLIQPNVGGENLVLLILQTMEKAWA